MRQLKFKDDKELASTVAQACNPSTLEGQSGQITCGETNMGNLVSTKNTKKLAGHGGAHL